MQSVKDAPAGTIPTFIGTPEYAAPEIMHGSYSTASDMWSIGVITYRLLCGHNPFDGETQSELNERIEAAEFKFRRGWSAPSHSSQSFVTALLVCCCCSSCCCVADLVQQVRDPTARMSAEEALSHEWIVGCDSHSDAQLSSEIVDRLKEYKQMSRTKRQILSRCVRV